jgi:hypothetical protein
MMGFEIRVSIKQLTIVICNIKVLFISVYRLYNLDYS